MNNVFVLSEKDLMKLAATIVLAVIFFGFSGLLIMLLFQWMARQRYAKDAGDKHGISQTNASRLGGASIFICIFGLILAGTYTGLSKGYDRLYGIYWFGWLGVIACAALGLVEDLRNNYLTPMFRLCCKTLIFALVIGLWPFLIPVDIGVQIISELMALPIIGWALTAVFCVGFINAINMADGANGLIPGVLTICFSVFYMETGGFVYATLMTSCALFTIFNLISGRLFLGDAGAYGLGAALALSGLFLFSEGIFSASYLAVMLAYPCLDILVSLARRRIQGRSVFLPDNDHLHNRLHYHCQLWFRSKTMANSITGVLIVLATSGIALIGYLYEWWPVTSEQWVIVFMIQLCVYFLTYYLTGFGRRVPQTAPGG